MRLEVPADTRTRLENQLSDHQEIAALAAVVCSLPPEHPLVMTMVTAVEVRIYRRAMAQAGQAISKAARQQGWRGRQPWLR